MKTEKHLNPKSPAVVLFFQTTFCQKHATQANIPRWTESSYFLRHSFRSTSSAMRIQREQLCTDTKGHGKLCGQHLTPFRSKKDTSQVCIVLLLKRSKQCRAICWLTIDRKNVVFKCRLDISHGSLQLPFGRIPCHFRCCLDLQMSFDQTLRHKNVVSTAGWIYAMGRFNYPWDVYHVISGVLWTHKCRLTRRFDTRIFCQPSEISKLKKVLTSLDRCVENLLVLTENELRTEK